MIDAPQRHRDTVGKRGRSKSSSITFPFASLCDEFLRSDMPNTPRFWGGFSGIDRDRSKEFSGGREGTEPSGRDAEPTGSSAPRGSVFVPCRDSVARGR